MISLSEIDTTAKRASRSVGFSWGISEEIGKNTKLSELFGIKGVKNLIKYFEIYKSKQFQNISLISEYNKSSISYCPIMLGVNFIDQIHIINNLKKSNKTIKKIICYEVIPLNNIDTLYKESDFIAITCPLTPMTKKMISFKQFSLMKDTAYIINIARGGVIDDEALIDALDQHKIFGGALDVFTDEPLQSGHPYFNYDNL